MIVDSKTLLRDTVRLTSLIARYSARYDPTDRLTLYADLASHFSELRDEEAKFLKDADAPN